jgi:hypothetical protein
MSNAVPGFVNGRPTKPDVDRLMAAFGQRKRDGSVLKHEEVESVIHEERRSSRYRTVVGAWRKRMVEESGVLIDGRKTRGEGYRFLTAGEMVVYGISEVSQATRKIGRGARAVGLAPDEELTAAERMKRDHVASHMSFLMRSMRAARKAIGVGPSSYDALPRSSG